jgi:hypothetical protein
MANCHALRHKFVDERSYESALQQLFQKTLVVKEYPFDVIDCPNREAHSVT